MYICIHFITVEPHATLDVPDGNCEH